MPVPQVVHDDEPEPWSRLELGFLMGPALREYEAEQAAWNARVAHRVPHRVPHRALGARAGLHVDAGEAALTVAEALLATSRSAPMNDANFDTRPAPATYRIGALDVPTPYSPPLEAAALPDKARVIQAARELLVY